MIPGKTRKMIALLALLAATSLWLARNRDEAANGPLDDLDTRLDYALWDFSAKLLNEKGEISVQIDAPILRNHAASQIGTVENPHIRIRQDQAEWIITADSAIITADRAFVSMAGSVNMLRRGDTPRGSMEIQTRDVMLNVTARTAVTESAVSIHENGDSVDALGMTLDLNDESYQLLEQVRAQYATP